MKYSTERKKRSRLLGHRKRRRIPDGWVSSGAVKVDWTEYKTLRQYQSLGQVLDGVRAYGFDAVKGQGVTTEVVGSNGHRWLTEDQEI